MIFKICVFWLLCRWDDLSIDLLIDFSSIWGSKIHPKSIKKVIENKMQVEMDFGWLLDRFSLDFDPKSGAKLGSSWHQNLRKWGTKTMSKNHQNKSDATSRKKIKPGVAGAL